MKNLTRKQVYIGYVVLLGIALLLIFPYFMNQKRLSLANFFYQKALRETNLREKLITALKSEALEAKDEKELLIADTYLRLENPEKAEKYLKKINNQEGIVRYTEAALEQNKITIGKKYLGKILNEDVKDELSAFISVAEGNFEAMADVPRSPATNLGRLLRVINTQNYEYEKIEGKLAEAIRKTELKSKQQFNNELKIAKALTENNQHQLALFILERLEKQVSSVDIYVLKVKIFEGMNKQEQALTELEHAIALAPENLNLLRQGALLADKAGDATKKNIFLDRIQLIEKIKGTN